MTHSGYRAGLNAGKQGFCSEKELFEFKSSIGEGLLGWDPKSHAS